MIVTYIRKPKPMSRDLLRFLDIEMVKALVPSGLPFGCLIAYKEDDKVLIGHSLCMKNDLFKKKTAIQIAKSNVGKPVPRSLQKHIPAFLKRCERYFKVEKIHVG